MVILFYSFIFTFFSAESEDFCNVENLLLVNDKVKNCKESQILFANIKFDSKRPNLKFKYNEEFNVKIPVKFNKEIVLFIKNNCQHDNLKIKTITNLIQDANINSYNNKIIVTCRFKK